MKIENSQTPANKTHSRYTAHDLKPVIELFKLLSEWNAQDVQKKREKSNEISQAVQYETRKD